MGVRCRRHVQSQWTGRDRLFSSIDVPAPAGRFALRCGVWTNRTYYWLSDAARATGELLFTLDAYLRSDLPTSVQLSWLQLENQPFDLRSEDVPADLRPLASLLLSTKIIAMGTPIRTVCRCRTMSKPRRESSANDTTFAFAFWRRSWEIDTSGAITLFVTGQVPVYDDIEAVFARNPVAGGSHYEVTGLESERRPTTCVDAGTDYPTYVEDRYLTLPESVTQRTQALAVSLAGERTTASTLPS